MRYTLTPAELGVAPAPSCDPALQGGTPAENAGVTRAILAGEEGSPADLALVNAGAAIYAAGAVETLAAGVEAARAALAGGAAARALEGYVQASHRHASAEAAR